MAATHLKEVEARMKLMQEQVRRIRETKSPEVRATLLREHMHTMMERALDDVAVLAANEWEARGVLGST